MAGAGTRRPPSELFRLAVAGIFAQRRLTAFHSTLVSKVAAFLSLLLCFRRLSMLVNFFLHVTGGFLHLTFDAHVSLHCWPQ